MVSGSPEVSNSFVSPYSNPFVSQPGWWWPALRMSPIHLSSPIAIHLSPSLAGGVRLSICFPLPQFICLPVWLVVSGSADVFAVAPKVSQLLPSLLRLLSSLPPVSQMWSPSCLLDPSCFQGFYTCCLVFHLSPRCGLPVVSQMWFPRCCLTVRLFWIVFQVSCRCGLPVVFHLFPDVVSQLSPRCGS